MKLGDRHKLVSKDISIYYCVCRDVEIRYRSKLLNKNCPFLAQNIKKKKMCIWCEQRKDFQTKAVWCVVNLCDDAYTYIVGDLDE